MWVAMWVKQERNCFFGRITHAIHDDEMLRMHMIPCINTNVTAVGIEESKSRQNSGAGAITHIDV